ncbi:TetR family transcriptional regulator [Gryllotalpicola koreensis]
MPEPARRRGRPRAGAQTDAREAILRAAGEEFAENGYDGTSLRAIARRASVDPALVHHYFEDKPALFHAVLSASGVVDSAFLAVLDGPRESLARGYLRYALTLYEQPAPREQMTALVRAAVGTTEMAHLSQIFVDGEVNARFAAIAAGPDPALRAGLVSTQLLGLFVARYVFEIEPLASASVDDLVELVAPTIERYLFGE